MLKIYIARHGQNEDNAQGVLNGHRDLPLTETGREQAKQLALGITQEGIAFERVYASPLSRAYETAEIVATALGLEKPTALPGLIERDFGVMTGKPVSEIEKWCGEEIIKTETITYFLSPQGAETFPELLVRAKRTLEEIEAHHKTGAVLLVTHGDIGKMLYASYYNIPWREILTMFHFGNSELLLLAHDSKAAEAHVVRIDQHNH